MQRALFLSAALVSAAGLIHAQEQADPRTLIPSATLNAIAQRGERSLLDIRNALTAEFGPVTLDDVTKFFRDLEKTGAYTIGQK